MNIKHIPAAKSLSSSTHNERTVLIALAGQPNMGKSTLFNLLTGLNQHVGNWPGKTVERKEGFFSSGGVRYRLVDLPGTYSLTANSPEEIIAREFILREKPDMVIAVVSAANLERSLYLVSELVSLPVPLIVALNMMDVAKREGIQIEADVLSAALGLPVVPMTASRAEGVHDLVAVIDDTVEGKQVLLPRQPEIRSDHVEVLQDVVQLISGSVPSPYPLDWVALKLLEGDGQVTEMMQEAIRPDQWKALYELLRRHDDAMLAIASGRYEWIGRMVRAAVIRPRLGQISLTAQLDRWLAHPFLGLLALGAMIGIIFGLTFTIGAPMQEWISVQVIARLAGVSAEALVRAPAWLSSLVVDGVIGGVGAVLTFLPILLIFFIVLGLLEDVGYMARAAYVMDNFMHVMGLHGKSFLPLFLGFGCNVPAVMGTRVIESWPARLLTILVTPLVPCTARMAVVAFLAPAFFGPYAMLVSWGLVITSLFILMITGILLNLLIFRGERSAFIMEMPLYHLPNWRTIGLLVWQRLLSFIKKAGTTILAVSVLVWALSVLPGGDLQTSFLAHLGKILEPVGSLIGLDWRLTVALITSFVAKENSIATLGVLFAAGESASLVRTLVSTFPVSTALSFLTISILFIPCAATVAAIRQETGSWRWTFLNIGMMLTISYGSAVVVYWFARMLGL
jgi:ferrous iron transport protein B